MTFEQHERGSDADAIDELRRIAGSGGHQPERDDLEDMTARQAAEHVAREYGMDRKLVKESPKGTWRTCCPAHGGDDANLTIRDKDGGGLLVKCFSQGCKGAVILDALEAIGINARGKDLKRHCGPPKRKTRPKSKPVPSDGAIPIYEAPADAPVFVRPSKYQGQWTYRDVNGNPIVHVVRRDPPKGRKIYSPITLWQTAEGNYEWRWKGHASGTQILYSLDQLIERSDEPVIWTEGEKDADGAAGRDFLRGYVPTTTIGGWQNAEHADASPVARRDLIGWPDNDEAGLEYISKMETLARKYGASSLRVVEYPPGVFPAKWGLADELPEDVDEAFLSDMLAKARVVFDDNADETERPASETPKSPPSAGPKPIAMAPEATPGIIGEIVQAACANSEADPAAVAATVLAYAGTAFGRSRYQMIGDEQHFPNMFLAIVGESAAGRKGTSMSGPRAIFKAAEDYIENENTRPFPLGHSMKQRSGLSTGEGLAFEIRDAEPEPDDESTERDMGEEDKRMLVFEPELAQVFTVGARAGNTLSIALRNVWDGRSPSAMTKTSRVMATDPHVSIVGHITKSELSTKLSSTDTSNGLANRFLWCFSQRPRLVPLPKPMSQHTIELLGARLGDLMLLAHSQTREMEMTPAAEAYWVDALYQNLETLPPNALGVILRRGAPYVRRLAMIYALLDAADAIDEAHLKSAHAFWTYGAESARLIFGDRQVDGNAQRILDALDDVDGELTKTGITRQVFGGRPPENLKDVLVDLEAAGEILSRKAKSTPRAKKLTTYYRRPPK